MSTGCCMETNLTISFIYFFKKEKETMALSDRADQIGLKRLFLERSILKQNTRCFQVYMEYSQEWITNKKQALVIKKQYMQVK